MAPPLPPPRPKHPDRCSYHLMSCILLLASTTTSTAAASTYSSACPSLAPAADRNNTDADDARSLTRSFQIYGHFSGRADDGLFDESSHLFYLSPYRAARTSDPALVHLAATLVLNGPHSRRGRNHTINGRASFVLDGYYSSASQQLCMVGTTTTTSSGTDTTGTSSTELATRSNHGDGDVITLRLRVPSPSNLADPFVIGTLEGSSDLGAIRLQAYAQGDDYDYEYGDSGSASTCSPPAATPLQAVGVGGDLPACAHLTQQLATLYGMVEQDDHHGPGVGAPAKLPRWMHVNQMHCTAEGAVRAYVVFAGDTENRGNFSFRVGDEAAVAEGRWDKARGMLCLRACQVVRSIPASTLAVGECGIGISFWFRAVWTVRDRSIVAGMLWNTSTQGRHIITGVADNDDDARRPFSGVNLISASSIDDPYHQRNLSGVRYEYNDTMLEEATKQYYLEIKKEMKSNGSFPAPGPYNTYHDFSLHFCGENSTWRGDAYPVSIGSVMMSMDMLPPATDDLISRRDSEIAGLLSISYDIHHYAPPGHWARHVSYSMKQQRISAEGVYDPERGILCMVGCRYVNGSTDCRVLVTVQFAPANDATGEGLGDGTGAISSLRDMADPFFFEKMDITLYGMYSVQLSTAVSRMDLESIILVLSTTLACVFAAVQILHIKRNPEVAPATSITMLALLPVGYLAPLALNFVNLFISRRSEYDFSYSAAPNDGWWWLELNQVMMQVPTLIALVLHLRLLQLVYTCRRRYDNDDQSVTSERAVLKICLPLYLLGALLATIVHAASEMDLPATLWEDLVSYTGLMLDGFLLPQIILNASSSSGGSCSGSGVQAISTWFYMGGTVIRVTPHVYDVLRLRVQAYEPSIMLSYVYANPRGGLFGVAWDFVIPCGATLLALILFLQQRHQAGGASSLLHSQRRSGAYGMVSHI